MNVPEITIQLLASDRELIAGFARAVEALREMQVQLPLARGRNERRLQKKRKKKR